MLVVYTCACRIKHDMLRLQMLQFATSNVSCPGTKELSLAIGRIGDGRRDGGPGRKGRQWVLRIVLVNQI